MSAARRAHPPLPARSALLAAGVPVAGALVQRALPQPLPDRFPLLPFLLAVAVVSGWAGRVAGFAALVVSVAAAQLVSGHPLDALALGVLLGAGTAIALFLGGAHGARLRAVAELRGRREAEAAARESRLRLEMALDSARMGYWTWDVASGAVSWSRNLERLHGLPTGAFGGSFESFLEVVHPDDRDRVRRAIRATLEEDAPYDLEFRVPLPDGSVRWMNGRGHLARGEDGRPAQMVGFAVDVTERHGADEVRSWLAAVVDSSEDAVIGHDPTGRILSWNAGAERLFGWSAAEAVGRTAALIAPEGTDEDFDGLFRRVLAGERLEHFETRRRTRDGRVLEVSLSVSPVLDAAGRLVGLAKIARDVTARNAEQAERERTREMFLGTLGHDLRNPLQTIAVSAQTLRRTADPATVRIVERIDASTRRMARMIDQLLDVTRSRLGGGLPMAQRETDLASVLLALVDELEAGGPRRFEVTAPPAAPGWWDGDRMAQALGNLLGNALEHGEPGTPVRVVLANEDDGVRVSVTNGGPAIPEELLPQLFDPFRTSRVGRRRGEGLGLGLYIADQIVRAHGGGISVTSRPGETTFVVRIPRGSAAAAAS